MKQLKMIGLTIVGAIALTALCGPGSASATTFEVGGATQNESVAFEASLASGTSMVLGTTGGSFVDTCTTSTFKGKTEGSFTGATVGGKLSSLTFGNCTHATMVDSLGAVTFEHGGGTNATVRFTGTSVTQESTTFGTTLNCTTSNTHFGTLVGSASGHATLKFNAVINCGFFVPSAKWQGEYTFTSPTGLGVVA